MRTMKIAHLHAVAPYLRNAAPLLITLCTVVIFIVDLNFPMGVAPWLPYFILAVAVARLYEPKTLLLATLSWSLAIVGDPFLSPYSGEPLSVVVFNRTVGVLTLWIVTGLLCLESRVRRARQKSEHTLQETISFIESLFEHFPNMVFVKDAKDLRFVRFNKAGEELLGYSSSQLLGKDDYDLFPKEQADFFAEKDRDTLRNKQLLDIPEEPIQTGSKGVRILHTKKIPICDSAGTPQYLLGISEDITERKQAEEALITARMAQEATQAKSDFLANMSHEMRTPLTAIVGISDYLLRTDLSKEQRGLLQRCIKASDGLLRMIEELLLAAKAESGTLRLVEAPFEIASVVRGSAALLMNQAEDKGLALTHHLAPGLPSHVIGDVHRLEQILLNLIRNAVKFTSAGSIAVHVAPGTEQGDRAEILFKVVDTGDGIPPGQEAQIFERFSQADSRSCGVGLGLAICKQLVHLMGGSIRATNNPQGGSTFAFSVQLKTVADAPTTIAADQSNGRSARTQRAVQAAPARALRILLAEDCVESQDIMRLYLRDTPHQLDCAATGIEVVTRFQKTPYDLVFMDLKMPDMDGHTATCVIRNWEQEQERPPTPIVALTANGLTEARIESQAAGCDEFLTKPIKLDTLLRVIERYATGAEAPGAGHKSWAPAREKAPRPREMTELKHRFIANRLRDLPVLQTAAAENDFERVRTIGHQLKGLAGSYDLDAIGAIGAAMEEAALQQDAQTVMAQLTRLADALGKTECIGVDDTGSAGRAA